MKKFKKVTICFLCAVVLLCSAGGITAEAAGDRYYPGEYRKKIGKQYYYISMNGYTSFETKYVGCFYIMKGKKNLKKFNYCKTGEFYKVSKNKYRYKTKQGSLTFTINKKSMKVKQKGTVIKGVKLTGTYTKTRKYQRP